MQFNEAHCTSDAQGELFVLDIIYPTANTWNFKDMPYLASMVLYVNDYVLDNVFFTNLVIP